MWPRTDPPRRVSLPAALALGLVLGGCGADLYLDRRDTIMLSGGDAVASNVAIHTIDPWPPVAANRTILTNGQRMQAAHERYRTNKVTPLANTQTSSVKYQPILAAPVPAAPAP